jgi:hypothetical protein
MAKTMFEKIWDAHVVHEQDGNCILYIDRHLVHEVTSPQAFDGLRMAGRKVRVPQRPATLIASSPSSGVVISTVACIFEMAPPAHAAISADAVLGLSGPSAMKQRS